MCAYQTHEWEDPLSAYEDQKFMVTHPQNPLFEPTRAIERIVERYAFPRTYTLNEFLNGSMAKTYKKPTIQFTPIGKLELAPDLMLEVANLYLASQRSLAREWLTPEEDDAWKHL